VIFPFLIFYIGGENESNKGINFAGTQHADGRIISIAYMWWFSWAAHKRVCYQMCWVWCIQKKRSINGRSIYITSISDERAVCGCAGERGHAKCILSHFSLFSVYNIQRQTPSSSFLPFFFAAAGPSQMSIEDGKENRRNVYTQWQQQHTMSYMLLGPSTSKTFRDIMAFSIFILFLLCSLYMSLSFMCTVRDSRERWRMESKRSFDIWLH
jgi:hypothetical protein